METAAAYAALFATALLFGGMAAFSFLFAPLIFAKLPIETAGGLIRGVFPWYYLFVIVASAIAGLALSASDALSAGLLLAAAAAGVVARQALMPRINQLRDAQLAGDAAAGARFDALHRASVLINVAQLVVAGVALARLV